MSQFYESCKITDSIGQGDIFPFLPFVHINSTSLIELVAEGSNPVPKEIDLIDYIDSGRSQKNIVSPTTIMPGIIISQNCDIHRSNHVSFCAIKKYEELEKNNTSPKIETQIEYLTKKYKTMDKYFYLPAIGGECGFGERMAVDFSCIYQLKIDVIEKLITKRKSRLGEIPLSHFRVKLGHYFERFAYDPWYVLNKSEFNIFYNNLPESEKKITSSLDWQK